MKTPLIASLAAAIFVAATLPALAVPHAGDTAPAISVPGDEPGTTLTTKRYLGKPVYVNFFASWCPPCNAEAPAVKRLAATFRKSGLVTLGIDDAEPPAKALQFARTYGWTFPVGADESGGLANDSFGGIGLPIHLFIDRAGKISTIRYGEMSPGDIAYAMKKIVAR